jgi:hypothetical protein
LKVLLHKGFVKMTDFDFGLIRGYFMTCQRCGSGNVIRKGRTKTARNWICACMDWILVTIRKNSFLSNIKKIKSIRVAEFFDIN